MKWRSWLCITKKLWKVLMKGRPMTHIAPWVNWCHNKMFSWPDHHRSSNHVNDHSTFTEESYHAMSALTVRYRTWPFLRTSVDSKFVINKQSGQARNFLLRKSIGKNPALTLVVDVCGPGVCVLTWRWEWTVCLPSFAKKMNHRPIFI